MSNTRPAVEAPESVVDRSIELALALGAPDPYAVVRRNIIACRQNAVQYDMPTVALLDTMDHYDAQLAYLSTRTVAHLRELLAER